MNHLLSKAQVLIVVPAAIVAVGWFALHISFDNRTRELAEKHGASIAALKHDWSRELAQRELDVRDATLERARRFQQELEAAMGGAAAAAAKNPDLSIGNSIQQVARACAPGTRVRVSVERFTEFTAQIEMPSRLAEDNIAQTAQCILAHCSEYLNRIQFTRGGIMIAELDRRAIESVADWQHASVAETAQLLSRPDSGASDPVATQSGGGKPDAEPEAQNLPEEEQKKQRASAAFNKALNEAHAQLASAVELQDQAAALKDVRQVRDFDAKLALIEKAEALASQARTVLENPAAEYQRILGAEALDELYIRVAVRTVEQQYGGSRRAAAAALFQTVVARTHSARGLVEVMVNHFGEWRYDELTRRTSYPQAARDITQAMDKWTADTKALNSASKAWSQVESQQAKAP